MSEKKKKIVGYFAWFYAYSTKRRDRMVEDSKLSLKKYSLKLALIVSFMLIDFILLPSIMISFRTTALGYALLIGIPLLVLLAVERKIISDIKP